MSNHWLKDFRPRPDWELRVYRSPCTGAGASVYRLRPDELPRAVQVRAVQPPGRESRWREEAFRQMDPFADAAAGGIEELLASG